MSRRSLARDRSGATALEFALVMPAFLMLLLGVFNAGYALYSGSAVRNAVQRASRTLIASPGTTDATLTSTVKAMLVDVPVQNFSLSSASSTVGTATVKTITWTYDFPVTVPFLPQKVFVFGSSIAMPM